MADLGTEIEEIFVLKKNCAVTGISRVVANVHLSYQQVFNRSIRRKPLANLYPTYQCIILAIRPLLLRLLEIHLKASGRLGGVDGKLSESVKALLQTCVDAARKILGILLALRDHNLLRKPASSTLSFQGPNTSQRVFAFRPGIRFLLGLRPHHSILDPAKLEPRQGLQWPDLQGHHYQHPR